MAAGNIQIRRATVAELPAALALARRSFLTAVAPCYSEEGVRAFLAFADDETMRLRVAENFVIYMAEVGGTLLGMAALRDGSHLAMLFVAPEVQRQGIGRALLAAVVAESTAERVTVNSSPNSEAAYRRFGFQPTSGEQVSAGIRFTPMALQRG